MSFPYHRWKPLVAELSQTYRQNQPVPHLWLPNFLDEVDARNALREFPRTASDYWTYYSHYNENTLGQSDRAKFPPAISKVVEELQSAEFSAWLSKLTGIEGLVPDPDLHGGGLHETERGGFLNVHTDFLEHHHRPNWRRRCNLILYLNVDWNLDWGGALELWDEAMRGCVVKYPPLFNHALIFTTDERSLHGYPEPLTCPPEESRKSLALYYYTVNDQTPKRSISTRYRARPQDGLRAVLIWLDTQALRLYSTIKARFGWSDRAVSRVLRLLRGRRRGDQRSSQRRSEEEDRPRI